MKKNRILGELIAFALLLVALPVALYSLGCALMPPRTEYGSTWNGYLQEREHTVDVLYFGSSLAYCNVNPAEIYRCTGITGYVMGGPSQTTSVMYYYVRESCKTQSPQYLFVEATGAFYSPYTDFSKVNVAYMPFSRNRILAARCCEPGILRGALFPLYDFHSRIFDSERETAAPWEDLLCGYTYLADSTSDLQDHDRVFPVALGSEDYERNVSYLEKIAGFCAQQGIGLVFYIAPSVGKIPADQRAALLERLEATGCVDVCDWSDSGAEFGVDAQTDWYDFCHLNTAGAVKFSAYLADYLRTLGLQHTATEDTALWAHRVAYCQARLEEVKSPMTDQ